MEIMNSFETSRETENVKDSFPDFVILQRHGSYQGFPGKDQPSVPQERLGHLTEQGEMEVKSSATIEIRKIMDIARDRGNKRVNFFILNSPSALIEPGTGKLFGKRARDTGRIVAGEVRNVIDNEYPEMSARLIEFGKSIEQTRDVRHLKEPNYYYVEGSENPMEYRNALTERFGPTNRWEAYHNVPPELEELRRSVGAEGSSDIAVKVKHLIKVLEKWATKYRYKTNNMVNVYWLVAHNDTLRSMIQHGFGVAESAGGYEPATGSIMEIRLFGGRLTTEFNNQEFSTNL